jgi:hypothetical protein
MSLRVKSLAQLVGLVGIAACTAIVDGDRSKTNLKDDPGSVGAVTGAQCAGSEVTNAKRLVRLSSNQHLNALGVLFGDAFKTKLKTDFDIADSSLRTFPPLASPSEGGVITTSHWKLSDNMAQAVGRYVLENFATVTGCGEAPTGVCAQAYLVDLAERAFRHPLSDAERTRLTDLYLAVKNGGDTVQVATQYTVYAILSTPQFLYRTEFGADAFVEGPLTAYEMASALSFFVADAPPDADLLFAAASGALSTAEQIGTQVTRLLATPVVRKNLEIAMLAYFDIGKLAGVEVDTAKYPVYTPELQRAMYKESQFFLTETLWNGTVPDLITSRKTRVNKDLASLYGITLPAGVTPDAEGYVSVELPPTRAGIVTQAAFLTSKARPDGASVVARGISLNSTLLCEPPPPFPENLQDSINAAKSALADATERQKAEYRAETNPCGACHIGFDPYGLALENFDILGAYRTQDEAGRAIDASVTLPDTTGGAAVADARAMAEVIAQSDAFTTCVARNVISYALAEGGVDIESCATHTVAENFKKTDRSFTSLVREVAVAKVFNTRSAGTKHP